MRLLASGPSGTRFVVAIPEARFEPAPGAPDLLEIRIPGCVNEGPVGSPALPLRVLQVAVPPTGEVRLSASAAAGEVRSGVLLAPPGLIPRDRENDPPRFERSAAAYAAEAPLAPQRARLLGVSWMRDQRVATIAILPADYEPAARRVTLHREIEVEITVSGGAGGATARGDDPFERVYRQTLVNYEAGRTWRRPPGAAAAGARAAGRAASARASAPGVLAVPDTSLFVGRDWVKIAIAKTGFYKVNFGQLRNTPLFSSLPGGSESARIDSLRLFTWPGNPVLPENSYCDSCEYREVAISIEESDPPDSILNRTNAEAFTFFALGPSDWADLYDPSQPESVYVNHPYETRNYYYLTVATAGQPVGGVPARIPKVPGAVQDDGGEIRLPDFAARVHVEQDIEYMPDLEPTSNASDAFWEKWFWKTLALGGQLSSAVETPGADSTQLATVRIRQWGVDGASHLMSVSINDQPLRAMGWFFASPFGYTADVPIYTLRSLAANTVNVGIPATPARTDRSALAWIEIRYRRTFVPRGDELAFDSPAAGNYIYDLGPFAGTKAPRVLDVTDAYAPVEIAPDSSGSAGAYRLAFESVEAGPRRYRVIPAAAIAGVPDASVTMAPATSRLNLRSRTRAADYLLIYYDGFQAAADSLAAWRVSHLPLEGASPPFAVTTIPISALYDQFSGGRTDPSAIRNFLRAAYFNWQKKPAFVTMLGDASYDFKNIKGLVSAGQPGSLVPSYENGFAISKQFATDDWLLNVDDPTRIIPDFYGGRIPAVDSRSALDFVLKKVLFYERQAPTGTWRDRVMLIADDQEQGADVDPLTWKHLEQTSDLDSTYTPPHVDRTYVYLHTYPDGPGETKPDAKAEIKKTVNDGVLMFNYIGHGSPFKIADETVLSDVDAGTFTNSARPTLFVAASCDVGKFSDPTVQSLGERMVLAPNGGAIAVISATEIAYSDRNVRLNWELYQQLFDRSAPGGQHYQSIAQALFIAKVNTSGGFVFNITNNSKYQVMGDAATRLLLPRLWVEVTLHGCDTCSAVLDSVQRGQTVHFRGQVYDRPGGTPLAFDGTADMLIEDSAPLDVAPDCSYCYFFPQYWFRAGAMFRGDVLVSGGALRGSFIVPIEAKGNDSDRPRTPRGRVRAYVQGRAAGAAYETDGVGSRFIQVSPGPPVTGDNAGPRITLSFASGTTTVRPDAVLRVDLLDPSGILITGHTLQNGIVVTLDENTTTRVDITPSFRYQTGSHTAGTASWQLPNLARGPHTIRVSAADNLAAGLTASQHRSSATISIVVAEAPPLSIVNAYLFPNPARSGVGGQFVVDALGDSVNAMLRIYTASGRMIRSMEFFGRQGQIQIPWDGLDEEGFALANGTYFFRVQLNARDAQGESSAQRKVAADGRFVILNR